MTKFNIPKKPAQPQRSVAEIELTKALKMVVDELTRLGFEDFYILGLVNLIINQHINPDGTFTKQYLELAKRAQEYKDKPEPPAIITIT